MCVVSLDPKNVKAPPQRFWSAAVGHPPRSLDSPCWPKAFAPSPRSGSPYGPPPCRLRTWRLLWMILDGCFRAAEVWFSMRVFSPVFISVQICPKCGFWGENIQIFQRSDDLQLHDWNTELGEKNNVMSGPRLNHLRTSALGEPSRFGDPPTPPWCPQHGACGVPTEDATIRSGLWN